MKAVPGIVAALVMFAGLLSSTPALAEKHSHINRARSSSATTYFFNIDHAAENAEYSILRDGTEDYIDQNWEGRSTRIGVGAELWNLLQLTTSYKFIGHNQRDLAAEELEGYGLDAGIKLVLKSPIINAELGTGVLGSSLEYRNGATRAAFHGSGLYNSLELNYYLSRSLSVYFHARQETEHLVRTSGDSDIEHLDTATTHMGIGVRVWMRRSLASTLRSAL